MSASEKLRALDTGRELYVDEGYRMYAVAKEENRLVRVLPLVANVVAAAEPCSDWVYITQEDSDALHAAIIALNDALEER